MLRRVARVLRGGLFVAGAMSLLYLPVSFAYIALAARETQGFSMAVDCEWGAIGVWYYWFSPTPYHPEPFGWVAVFHPESEAIRPSEPSLWSALLPRVGKRSMSLPLWLLAFLCLAWPVTSFVIARRKRSRRGFEVAAKEGSEVSTVDS